MTGIMATWFSSASGLLGLGEFPYLVRAEVLNIKMRTLNIGSGTW